MTQTLPIQHTDWLLDAYQLKAVQSPIEISVVEAVAGSGKTRTTIHRIANLIDHGVLPEKIMLVTFTNQAAKEMTQRLNDLIGKRGGYVQSGTFHALALRYIRSFYGRHAYTVLDPGEDEQILKEIIQDYIEILLEEMPVESHKSQRRYLQQKFYAKSILNWISSAINAKQNLRDVLIHQTRYGKNKNEITLQELKDLNYAYQAYKKEHHLLNFDDILLLFIEMLKNQATGSSIRKQVDHLLVDEYQDINPLQFDIIQYLTKNSLMAIGDKAQSIYGWRGSNSNYIIQFETYFPNAKRYTISKNYRSGHEILKTAEEILDINIPHYGKIQLVPNKQGGQVELLAFEDSQTEAEYITREIIQWNQTQKQPWSECAVLLRTRASMGVYEQLFRRYKVPYVLVGGLSFYDRRVVKDFINFFKLIHSPNIPIYYDRFLKLFPGVGAVNALRLKETLLDCKGDYQLVKNTYPKHDNLIDLLEVALDYQAEPPLFLAQYFYKEFYKDYLLNRHSDRSGNIDKEALGEETELVNVLIQELATYSSLESFLQSIELLDRQPGQEEQEDCVTISTMHAAKGLEWDFVSCPSWNKSQMPLEYNDTNPQEEVNLAYVSATRARERLILSTTEYIYQWGRRTKAFPSPFLKALSQPIENHNPMSPIRIYGSRREGDPKLSIQFDGF